MTEALKGKKIIFFHEEFVNPAGSERFTLEEARCFERMGAKTFVVTFNFHPDVLFNSRYRQDVQIISKPVLYHQSPVKGILYFPWQVMALRKKLRQIRPDIIISRTTFGCIYLYLATLFTPFSYAVKIYETPIWSYGDQRQHALIYRKAFRKIRELEPIHQQFAYHTPRRVNPLKRLLAELAALAEYHGVRKARRLIAYSNMMKWEAEQIFKKEVIALKCSVPEEMFTYEPKQDIKQKLDLSGRKMILSVSRLAERKRIDLLIRAFSHLSDQFNDAVLVIGGRGPEEEKLKTLAHELKIEGRVKFAGFISENELWDYYAACDIFAHPDWADTDLTPIMALALKKKVVWTTDMELDPKLRDSGYIFVAKPNPEDFARAIEQALISNPGKMIDLSAYAWKKNCDTLLRELSPFLR